MSNKKVTHYIGAVDGPWQISRPYHVYANSPEAAATEVANEHLAEEGLVADDLDGATVSVVPASRTTEFILEPTPGFIARKKE